RVGWHPGQVAAVLGGGCRLPTALARGSWSPRATPITALGVALEAAAPAAVTTHPTTVAAEATAFAAKAAALAIAPVVAIALAHLHRRFGFVLLDANRQKADDVGGQAHAALHLGNRGRRCVDVHQRIVGLAVLLDFEREALEAPILALADPPTTFGDDFAVFLRQCFHLRLADILARQKHVLVERHRLAFPSVAVRSGAKPLLGPRQLSARKGPKDPKGRRAGEPGIALPSRLWCEPASRSASNRSGWWRLLYAIASSGQAQRQRPEGAADVPTRSPARARWGCVARCVP